MRQLLSRTDRPADRQDAKQSITVSQAVRQAGKQADRQTGTETDRHVEVETIRQTEERH